MEEIKHDLLAELKALCVKYDEDSFGSILGKHPDDLDYEEIDAGEWIQDGKCQYQDSIYKVNGRYFNVQQSRSGSYHTDWHFGQCEVEEFEKAPDVANIKITCDMKEVGDILKKLEEYGLGDKISVSKITNRWVAKD